MNSRSLCVIALTALLSTSICMAETTDTNFKWPDVPQSYDYKYGESMVKKLRELQPNILINNRAFSVARKSHFANQTKAGDYLTPEQRIGGFNRDYPWETCMTICRQWAWKPNDKQQEIATVITFTLDGDALTVTPVDIKDKPSGSRATDKKDLSSKHISKSNFDKKPPASSDIEAFRKWRDDTRKERCAWWKRDRFGMFIHWGVYSVPAGTYKGKRIGGIGEWIMLKGKIPVDDYRAFAKQFNPVKYDPDAWVRLAKEAGMKYIVITSKHHDGFALFNSKVTDWDIVDATPYGKDLLKPLAEACRKHGIKLGFYYSQAQDWNHPGGAAFSKKWDKKQEGDMDTYLDKIAIPQVKELLGGNYGDLGIFWWDTPKNMTPERAAKLYPLLKLQPQVISNNRLGGGFGGDYGTPEQRIPKSDEGKNWETCMTMNGTWGYKSYDTNWKSTKQLIHNLVDIVGKNGNYLLNVGPKPDGTFPQASIDRLKEIGKWMKVNGKSIYGCGVGPLPKPPPWGRLTAGNNRLYLHVFTAPTDGKLTLEGISGKPKKAWLLADPECNPLKLASEEGKVIINLPKAIPDPIDTVVALDVEDK